MPNTDDSPPNVQKAAQAPPVHHRFTDGAVGAGLVLVVLPSIALFLGVVYLKGHLAVALPVLAIFGIMILFGSMSLTSTLFARLNLSNRNEALALPTGSIRAAIALSLIVLFAIIAIMLFQSLAEPYRITGLTQDEQAAITKDPRNRVLAVRVAACATSAAGAASAPRDAASSPALCYDVHLVQSAGQEAIDIAKQLLILVGTLMTSVTSYYFASRTAQSSSPTDIRPNQPNIPTQNGTPDDGKSPPGTADTDVTPPIVAPTTVAQPLSTLQTAANPVTPQASKARQAMAVDAPEDHDILEGCGLPITDPTTDADLPPAKGGVQS